LKEYAFDVLPDPRRFEREVERSGISLVLVRARDSRMQVLARHLAQAPDWPLVYWSGEHAIHARRVAANTALIERFGYRVLRPSFDLSYLAAPGQLKVAKDDLMHDFDRVRNESEVAGAAIEAALVVALGGDQLSRAQAESAAATLSSAAGQLPPSADLLHSLESALAAARR
jgi:hypothetical protein